MTEQTEIVAEFSSKQNCFHVEPLEYALQTNRRGTLTHCALDYIPLAIFPTYEAANDFCREFRQRMEKR